TDIIVGFPTETDLEFEDTVRIMQAVQFDTAFMFKYSVRPNTEAERKLKDDVTEAQKTARIVRINTLQADISLQKNKFVVGRIQSVMIESSRDIKGGALYGRNDANKIVVLPQGAASPGDIMNVRIIRATPHQLKGEVVDSL
ncbi:MAG: TRAM domain-containing protein, partial [Candidatus Omnitrophota bacterium]